MNPETRLDQFLDLLAISGEIPKKLEHRLPGGYEYSRKVTRYARQRGLIRLYRKDELRGLRLTAKGKEYLLERRPERVGPFLTGSGDTHIIPSEEWRRSRLHRTAEALNFMRNAGAEIYPDRKPLLFSGQDLEEEIIVPAFYTAKEIKDLGVEAQRIRNSRAVGTLVLPDSFYVVYNTGRQQMEWYENAEERMAALMELLLRQIGAFPPGIDPKADAILLADSMERFYSFIDKPTKKGALPLNGGCYQKMLWLPSTEEGEALLRLLSDRKKRGVFYYTVLRSFRKPQDEFLRSYMDAEDGHGKAVLFAYDGDVAKVHRFLCRLANFNQRGIIVCFDFQGELMQRLCRDRAKVLTLDLAAARKDFEV